MILGTGLQLGEIRNETKRTMQYRCCCTRSKSAMARSSLKD